MGWLYYHLAKKRVQIARINIQLCYPLLTKQQQENLVKQSFLEAGMWVCESGAAWLWSNDKILTSVIVKNEEVLTNAFNQQRGVIIVAPHLGNWEMLSSVIGSQYEFASFYKDDHHAALLSKFIHKQRSKRGVTMAPANIHGIRILLKQLHNKKISVLLPDHKPANNAGVFAPFFGNQALTSTLVSSLAKRTNAIVITISILRTATGFEVVYSPVENQHNEDQLVAATSLNHSIEKCIALAPAQFQWVYSRFSKQPTGIVSPYK